MHLIVSLENSKDRGFAAVVQERRAGMASKTCYCNYTVNGASRIKYLSLEDITCQDFSEYFTVGAAQK